VLGANDGDHTDEGLWPSSQCVRLAVPTQSRAFDIVVGGNQGANADAEAPSLFIDFLVLHEGAIDIFCANHGMKWTLGDTTGLLAIAPGIVRTSGRGRHSRNLGNWVPFLEASTLTAALVTSQNKYSLSRALLGATGSVAEETKSECAR
jgi:hypothetical protein